MIRLALFHNLPSGGAKRALFETVQRLAQNHTIDCYTLSSANSSFCDLRPFVHNHYVFEFEPLPLLGSPFGRLNQLQRWRSLQKLNTLSQQIAERIDTQHYDLVYAHPSLWTQAPTILRYLQTPTIYHVHEPLRLVYDPKILRPYIKEGWRDRMDQFDPLKSLYLKEVTRLDYCNTVTATRLLSNSHHTTSNIQRFYGQPSTVAYFAVDTESFHPIQHLEKSDFVLAVGEINPNKGYDFLIKAIGSIPSPARPPLRIIGNANNRQEYNYLIDLAQKYQVDFTVEIMVDQETLLRRYNEALLIVYAPLREPFGLVALEAMACGTPVVGVAEGGLNESIKNGFSGLLVERDEHQFADAVCRLLENDKERITLGQQARYHVLEHWTWERSVKNLESHFYEFIDDQSHKKVQQKTYKASPL